MKVYQRGVKAFQRESCGIRLLWARKAEGVLAPKSTISSRKQHFVSADA